MQTNKHFCSLCKSEAYWACVATPMVRDTVWENFTAPRYMVRLHKSYKDTLDYFIQRVRDELRTSQTDVRGRLTVQCLSWWSLDNK